MITRNYNVMQHPGYGTIAFPSGISGLGFLFTWVWALFTRQWLVAIVTVVSLFIFGAIVGDLANPQSQDSMIMLANIIVQFIFGWYGNEWRTNKMDSMGYSLVDVVKAKNKKQAVAIAIDSKYNEEHENAYNHA